MCNKVVPTTKCVDHYFLQGSLFVYKHNETKQLLTKRESR